MPLHTFTPVNNVGVMTKMTGNLGNNSEGN